MHTEPVQEVCEPGFYESVVEKYMRFVLDWVFRECDYEKLIQTEKKYEIPAEEINIHVIPHSHTDAGWIEQVDWYYKNWVKNIFKHIVNEMYKDPTITFVWAETNYLHQWYESQKQKEKDKFLTIVKRGQIEFVGGGWVQNDESLSDLKSIINQMNLGLQYLEERFNATPKVGWQIDPFGYNHFMPGVFSELGYDYLVLNRIGDIEKEKFKKQSDMDFWLQSADLGHNPDKILTHVLPRHYEPYKYDSLLSSIPKGEEWSDSVRKFIMNFYETYVEQQIKGYKSNEYMLLMGKDFAFKDWSNCLSKIGRMNRLVTKFSKDVLGFQINWNFSTPSTYFEAVNKLSNLTTLSTDFLNYDERLIYLHPNEDYDKIDYWVGYYFTRPHLKKRIHDSFNLFRTVETLLAYIQHDGNNYDRLQGEKDTIEKQLSYMLHHDAITGTSRKGTIDDYYRRIEKSEYMMNQLFDEINEILLGNATEATGIPDESGITKKPLHYFNQAVYKRELVITIPIYEKYVKVYDLEKQQYLRAELIEGVNTSKNQLFVLIEVNGLTMKSLTLEISDTEMEQQAKIIQPISFDFWEFKRFKNEYFTLTLEDSTLIKTFKRNSGIAIDIDQQFNRFNNTLSGLYVFKPENEKYDIEYIPKNAYVYLGSLITYVSSENKKSEHSIKQSITIFHHGETQIAPLVEITAKPWKFTELGFSMSTKNFSSSQEFYNNDSNEFVKRKFSRINDFEETGKNVYPVVHGYAVKDTDDENVFGIINNYPTGCGFITNNMNMIECFLTRTTDVDDDKGVPDKLEDRREISFSFFLTLSNVSDYADEYKVLSDYFNLPLTTKFDSPAFELLKINGMTTELHTDDYISHTFNSKDYFYSKPSFSLLKDNLDLNFEVFDIFENYKNDTFIRIRNRQFKQFIGQKQSADLMKLDLEKTFIFELEKNSKYTLDGLKRINDRSDDFIPMNDFISQTLKYIADENDNSTKVLEDSKNYTSSIKINPREIVTLKIKSKPNDSK